MLRDGSPDTGPLEGLRVALDWARGVGAGGTLVLAVDTPFVPPDLLARLAEDGQRTGSVCLPESDGPRGFEPLCGWYPVSCLEDLNQILADGGRAFVDLVNRAPTMLLPLDEVRRYGDPAVQFVNVNRPETLEEAKRLLASDGVAV
jgi:molybdopterin-guanine dinucleotide biosynthesis protein A